MNPVINSAIEAIDRKIKELEDAKRALMDAFGIKTEKMQPQLFVTIPTSKAAGTRRDDVVAVLREHPGLTRSEIHQRTGFPLGTISFVLNQRDDSGSRKFENREGKWYVKEKMKVVRPNAGPFTEDMNEKEKES